MPGDLDRLRQNVSQISLSTAPRLSSPAGKPADYRVADITLTACRSRGDTAFGKSRGLTNGDFVFAEAKVLPYCSTLLATKLGIMCARRPEGRQHLFAERLSGVSSRQQPDTGTRRRACSRLHRDWRTIEYTSRRADKNLRTVIELASRSHEHRCSVSERPSWNHRCAARRPAGHRLRRVDI